MISQRVIRQLQNQFLLLLVVFLAHSVLINSGIGRYSIPDPQWYHAVDMTLMVSTTVGMSSMTPSNVPAMAITWIHTLLIFVLLVL